MGKISIEKSVFGIFLLVLIAAGEVVAHFLHLPAWPAFLIMIFFFMAHMDRKQIPHMLVGCTYGILLTIVLVKVVMALIAAGVPRLAAVVGFVLVFVYSIVLLADVLPWLFNNYAFMSFLFATTYMKTAEAADPFVLVAILLVGGGLFLLGIIGIANLTGKILAPRKTATENA